MVGTTFRHGAMVDRFIKGDETALMRRGQGQQVYVRHLSWTKNVRRIDQRLIQKRNAIRPEPVLRPLSERAKNGHHRCGCEWPSRIIRRVRHDSDYTVLRERAGCPSATTVRLPPCVGTVMKIVIGIEERDNYVDI